VYFHMVCVTTFCAQIGFVYGIIIWILHAFVIEKLGTLSFIVKSLIFHMSSMWGLGFCVVLLGK